MDSLPAWARWIVVVVLGLSPIFTYLIAGIVGRFLLRRRWPLPPGGGSIVVERPTSAPKDEAADLRILSRSTVER